MSSERRASSASSASTDSMRLRSRMSGCERAGSAQMAGSAVFSSIAVSSRRRRGASKILPQIANLLANRGVGVLEVGNHVCFSLRQFGSQAKSECRGRYQRADVGEQVSVRGVEGEAIL